MRLSLGMPALYIGLVLAARVLGYLSGLLSGEPPMNPVVEVGPIRVEPGAPGLGNPAVGWIYDDVLSICCLPEQVVSRSYAYLR